MAIRREYFRALKAVLEKAGATEIAFKSKGGRPHPHIIFNLGGKRYKQSVPDSPSDHRALKNDIAALRRRIREHKPS